MRGAVPALLSGLLCLFAAGAGSGAEPVPPGWDASLYMGLDEIKPGMKGVGRSVFRGTAVEEFDVEILGILPTSTPDGNMILARLTGMGLEESGIIAGMSGSPVYVEGRLIGAVAFGWPFASVPIGGITPIASMLAVADRGGTAEAEGTRTEPRPRGGISPQAWNELRVTRGEAALDLLVKGTGSSGGGLLPLQVPVAMQGFRGPGLEAASRYLERLGFVAVAGGTMGEDPPGADSSTLEPGSAVAVELVRGDAQLAAIGTVTWVEGERVLAFGHPMMNMGSTAYPMAQARILTVMPRLTNSFKMGVAGALVGTILRDDQAGIMGTLGPTPRLIPLVVTIGGGDPSGEVHFEVLDADALTPALVGLLALNTAGSRMRSTGAATLRVRNTVRLADGRTITVADRLAGFTPPADLAGEVARLVGLVASNPFERVEIQDISLQVDVEDGIEAAFVEGITIPPGPHRPGARLPVQVRLRDYRGKLWTRVVSLDLPAGLGAGTYSLSVCDGEQAMSQDEKRAPGSYRPRSLDQLLRLLEDSIPRDVLVVRLLEAAGSPLAGGRELPRLPASLEGALRSPLASAGTEESSATIVAELQDPVGKVLVGCATLPLEIEPAP